jgi:hypothetical protein
MLGITMSIISPPVAPALQPPPYPIWQFTVDEYHQLIQQGILTEVHRSADPCWLARALAICNYAAGE